MELMNIIKQSIDTTYNKYYAGTNVSLERFIEDAIEKIIKDQDYSRFTSTNNARINIQAIGKEALMVELIKGAYAMYTVQTTKGCLRVQNTVGASGYPESKQEAVNYIFKQISDRQPPSFIYNNLLTSLPTVMDLLISSYAELISSYSLEEIKYAENLYAPYFQGQINELNNFQNSLIVNPNQLVNEDSKLY